MPKTNFFQDQAEQDQELLEVVIESGKLSQREEESFQDMLSRSKERRAELTTNQRAWLQRVKQEIDQNHEHFNLLASVLGAGNRLRENEREAFEDMIQGVTRSRKLLTVAQVTWAKSCAEKYDVGDDAPLNLHSAEKVPEGLERKEKLLPWEQPGYVKPTRPPGRL